MMERAIMGNLSTLGGEAAIEEVMRGYRKLEETKK